MRAWLTWCSRTGASATICARCSRAWRRRSTPSMRVSSRCPRRRSRASAMPVALPCRWNCATAARILPSYKTSPMQSSPMRSRRAHCSAFQRRFEPQRRSSGSTSIASKLRPCTCRSTRYFPPWRPISAPPTFLNSTNSAGYSRSMPKPMRNSDCVRATSRICGCAINRAT